MRKRIAIHGILIHTPLLKGTPVHPISNVKNEINWNKECFLLLDVENSFLESWKKAKVFFSFSSKVHFEAIFTYAAEELDPRSAICWSQWEVKDAQNHALIANLAWR